MDTSVHNITALFAQLGLETSPIGVEYFIKTNVIADSLQQDSDWSEIIDQLDIMLRN